MSCLNERLTQILWLIYFVRGQQTTQDLPPSGFGCGGLSFFRIDAIHNFHPECNNQDRVLPIPRIPSDQPYHGAAGGGVCDGVGVAWTNAYVDSTGNVKYESALSDLIFKSFSTAPSSGYHAPQLAVQGTDYCLVNKHIAYMINVNNKVEWRRVDIVDAGLWNSGGGTTVWNPSFIANSGPIFTANSNSCPIRPTDYITCDPTRDPTPAPTFAPSSPPTRSPTDSPTLTPTRSPSAFPTTPPTTAPSTSPTRAPSLAPSQSPTACIDYFNYTSLDGQDIIDAYDNDIPSIRNETFAHNMSIQEHISHESDNYFFRMVITCNHTDDDICFIGCYGAGHCAMATVRGAIDTKWKEIRIICSKNACYSLVVNITNTEVDTLSILCGESFSCQDLHATIHSVSNIQLSIDCNELFSCKGMNIHLIHGIDNGDSINDIHLNVTCYHENSCDNMIIQTDHSPHIFINLHAMRYSEHISIHYRLLRNIKARCGIDGDRRYIRYDTHRPPEAYKVLSLARNEYNSRKLPCEDIRVYCSDNSHFDRECEYKYALRNVSLSQILMDDDKPICYWMELGQLYKAQCEGTCDDSYSYTRHIITFALDIVLNHNDDDNDKRDIRRRLQNDPNVTKSNRICDRYFGSKNSTDDTLSSIDAIFTDVLGLITSVDDRLIHDLFLPPQTILRDDLEAMNCTKEAINIIRINTTVGIESAEENIENIDVIFGDIDTYQFLNKSTALLSKLFGIAVTINPQALDVTVKNGLDTMVVIGIGGGALVFCGVAIAIWVHCAKKRREAKTTYVHNPMVLFVGIGTYEHENPPEHPEVDGYFRNLDGIALDYANINMLFGETLNYEVVTRRNKYDWTLEELKLFLKENARKLEQSNAYDGLVVVLSCHGITDYVVTSDYQKIRKTRIHRIFSEDKPKNREIPRVFILDCCDGDSMKEIGVFRSDEDDLEGAAANGASTMPKSAGDHLALATPNKAQSKEESRGELRKNMSVKQLEGLWLQGERNPDYRLCTIFAANEGFVSILDKKTGSHAITAFTERMKENMENGNKKWFFEICNEMQNALQTEGKQHTVNTFNDTMEYLKFKRNDDSNSANHMRKPIEEVISDGDTDGIELAAASNTSTTKGGPGSRFAKDTRQISPQDKVQQFLGELGLEEYYDDFAKNGYSTLKSLYSMDEKTIRDKFNIKQATHRELILNAITDLRNNAKARKGKKKKTDNNTTGSNKAIAKDQTKGKGSAKQSKSAKKRPNSSSSKKGGDLKEWMTSCNVFNKPLHSALVANGIDSLQKLKVMDQAAFGAMVRKFRADRFTKVKDKKKRAVIDTLLVQFEKSYSDLH